METITIPSPSVFLATSPVQSPKEASEKTPPPKPKASKPKQATPKQPASKDKKIAGITKPKQSKSRNGMSECAPGLIGADLSQAASLAKRNGSNATRRSPHANNATRGMLPVADTRKTSNGGPSRRRRSQTRRCRRGRRRVCPQHLPSFHMHANC